MTDVSEDAVIKGTEAETTFFRAPWILHSFNSGEFGQLCLQRTNTIL